MPHDGELVTVFETGNSSLLAIVKSILDGAEIPYLARGEGLQNLFGMGVIGTGFNVLVGPVQIQVREEDASTARELLEGIDEADDSV